MHELQRRAREVDRQIAEHEARQHERRVQREGEDYVQDSYLLKDSDLSGGDDSSTCSLDSLLLAVGEEDLDDYLRLCDGLYEIVERIDQTRRREQSLVLEIQTEAASPGDREGDGPPHTDRQQEEEEVENSQLEALQVQLTRAVSASVLQQQQELDVAKELRLLEVRVKDRWRTARQLEKELESDEGQGSVGQGGSSSCDPAGFRGDGGPLLFVHHSDSHSQPHAVHAAHWERPAGPAHLPDPRSCVQSERTEDGTTLQSDSRPQLPPRNRSRSRERTEKTGKPPVPLPRSRHNIRHAVTGPAGQLCSVSGPGFTADTDSDRDTRRTNRGSVVFKDSHTNTTGKEEASVIANDQPTYPSYSSNEPSQTRMPKERASRQEHSRSNGPVIKAHTSYPGFPSRNLDLCSSKDDSGMCSSDSSTDSGLLLFDLTDGPTGECVTGACDRQRAVFPESPGSLLDVSVSCCGGGSGGGGGGGGGDDSSGVHHPWKKSSVFPSFSEGSASSGQTSLAGDVSSLGNVPSFRQTARGDVASSYLSRNMPSYNSTGNVSSYDSRGNVSFYNSVGDVSSYDPSLTGSSSHMPSSSGYHVSSVATASCSFHSSSSGNDSSRKSSAAGNMASSNASSTDNVHPYVSPSSIPSYSSPEESSSNDSKLPSNTHPGRAPSPLSGSILTYHSSSAGVPTQDGDPDVRVEAPVPSTPVNPATRPRGSTSSFPRHTPTWSKSSGHVQPMSSAGFSLEDSSSCLPQPQARDMFSQHTDVGPTGPLPQQGYLPPELSDSYDDMSEDTVPIIVTDTDPDPAHPLVPIISSGKHKKRDENSTSSSSSSALPSRCGKTVRFADEMTSWWWCDDDLDDAADSSDDTGLSSLHDEDALETLV